MSRAGYPCGQGDVVVAVAHAATEGDRRPGHCLGAGVEAQPRPFSRGRSPRPTGPLRRAEALVPVEERIHASPRVVQDMGPAHACHTPRVLLTGSDRVIPFSRSCVRWCGLRQQFGRAARDAVRQRFRRLAGIAPRAVGKVERTRRPVPSCGALARYGCGGSRRGQDVRSCHLGGGSRPMDGVVSGSLGSDRDGARWMARHRQGIVRVPEQGTEGVPSLGTGSDGPAERGAPRPGGRTFGLGSIGRPSGSRSRRSDPRRTPRHDPATRLVAPPCGRRQIGRRRPA